MKSLTELNFRNSYVEDLPGDQSKDRASRTTDKACYALIDPEPVAEPKLLAWSNDLAEKFALQKPGPSDTALSLLAGNLVLPTMKPFAACYGGHQFGQWAGQLGDGRAITLGEIADTTGQCWELQLKGAGRTPYSRFADGRAVLRSSVREFLASEGMYHLGVPTTRALSLMATGEVVDRDMFYSGNIVGEPGAIVARMSPSFLRFGHYEIHTSRGDLVTLKRLVDWTINKYFSFIVGTETDRYFLWFEEVCRRTAKMIVEWDRVGFVHGVMNTDNMSILGLTIDYGPYGWLDDYNPQWTPNTTDLPGRRYAFGNQAKVALWNLERLAFAIAPLLSETEPLELGLNAFVGDYNSLSKQMMANKLCLGEWQESDQELLYQLIKLFGLAEVDWTIFFRKLYELVASQNLDFSFESALRTLSPAVYSVMNDEFKNASKEWIEEYQQRLKQGSLAEMPQRLQTMKFANPKYIPRNYLLYEAIRALEANDSRPFEDLYYVLQQPYEDHPEFEHLAGKRPDWAKSTPGCSTLSCSS